MIDLNNYSQIIYVDAINGDDTIGDGSSNNPYASVIKAVNSATLDNTLIYLKKGIYTIEKGLSSTIRTDIELIFFGETVLKRDKKVIFDLQATYQNNPKMTKQHTYIGIVFKRSGIASSVYNDTRVYEYFNDSSTLNIQFKNCVFDVGDITPSDFIIYTGQSSGCTIIKLEYIHCSIIPNNLSGKKDSLYRRGVFINCAIADSDLTTDMPNQLSSTFDYNYELTNPSGEYGVYFGEYAWKRYINKTLILSSGEYKKYINKIPEQLPKSIVPNMTSNTSPSPYVVSSLNLYNNGREPFKAFSDNMTVSDSFLSSLNVFETWIKIDLGATNAQIVQKLEILGGTENINLSATNISIEASNDDINWILLGEKEVTNWLDWEVISFNNEVPYRFYKINANRDTPGAIMITKINLYDLAENIPAVPSSWTTVSSALPTLTQFLEEGMDDLSILNRQVQELDPMPMEDKTNILFTNGEVGKVFSKTIDLKKYFDIRNLKVEVK